jgi:hypothetical protein
MAAYQWLQQDDFANPLSDVFNWLRGKEPASGNIQNASSCNGGKKLGLVGSSGLTPAEQRAKKWKMLSDGFITTTNYDSLDKDEQTIATIQNILSMVQDALERNPIKLAATMEGALDWLRSNGASKIFCCDYPSQASTRRTAATWLDSPWSSRSNGTRSDLVKTERYLRSF